MPKRTTNPRVLADHARVVNFATRSIQKEKAQRCTAPGETGTLSAKALSGPCVLRCWRARFCRHPRSVLDFPLFLAAFLLRVALVLPALGIALVVFGPAIDFA